MSETNQTTLAVIATAAGGPEVLDIVARPRPVPGDGEMLVRVRAAGLNRIDVMQRQGIYPVPPGVSDVLGLELAGVVESLGPGTGRYRRGDRVMALVSGGAQAEWAVVQEGATLPIPDDMSFEQAGAFPETYFTVWSNVFERAGLKQGETLLIHGGASGIGTTATMLGKAFGARVIMTAGSPEKCAACVALGADGAIDYRNEDFVVRAKELTGGLGPDVILDTIGGDYISRDIEAIAVDGRIAQIASAQPRADVNLALLRKKRVTLTGSSLRLQPPAMQARLAAAIEAQVLPLLRKGEARPLIDSTFPFEQVRDAHARLEGGQHVGKIVLTMGEG